MFEPKQPFVYLWWTWRKVDTFIYLVFFFLHFGLECILHNLNSQPWSHFNALSCRPPHVWWWLRVLRIKCDRWRIINQNYQLCIMKRVYSSLQVFKALFFPSVQIWQEALIRDAHLYAGCVVLLEITRLLPIFWICSHSSPSSAAVAAKVFATCTSLLEFWGFFILH